MEEKLKRMFNRGAASGPSARSICQLHSHKVVYVSKTYLTQTLTDSAESFDINRKTNKQKILMLNVEKFVALNAAGINLMWTIFTTSTCKFLEGAE